METAERTEEQDDELINTAHASAYHWTQVGTPANRARSEWQLSRAYTVLDRPEPALHHARRCLAYCEENPEAIEDWDLPYAHEALARAMRLPARRTLRGATRRRRAELAAGVTGAEDREHLEADLGTLLAVPRTAPRLRTARSARG